MSSRTFAAFKWPRKNKGPPPCAAYGKPPTTGMVYGRGWLDLGEADQRKRAAIESLGEPADNNEDEAARD
jgi:hypothetical protein